MDPRLPKYTLIKCLKLRNTKNFKREKNITQRNENQMYIMFHWHDMDARRQWRNNFQLLRITLYPRIQEPIKSEVKDIFGYIGTQKFTSFRPL